jgi:hypothetical protein
VVEAGARNPDQGGEIKIGSLARSDAQDTQDDDPPELERLAAPAAATSTRDGS